MAGKAESSPRNGRKGGRPKGALNKATLEKAKVQAAFEQRVMANADRLFNAQFSLAVGTSKVFRVDEVGSGKDKKRVHSLVTNEEEIKAFLDECEGGSGEVNKVFYYITTAQPDNKALDSLLNRGLGKVKETHELTGKDGKPIEHKLSGLSDEELIALERITAKLTK
jgi:hypothetical protein